jgi:hypothetical protein
MAQVLRQSVGLAVFCLVAFASLSYKYGNDLTPFFCSPKPINMKSKTLASALVLTLLLSACSRSRLQTPSPNGAHLYVVIYPRSVEYDSMFVGTHSMTYGAKISVYQYCSTLFDTINIVCPPHVLYDTVDMGILPNYPTNQHNTCYGINVDAYPDSSGIRVGSKHVSGQQTIYTKDTGSILINIVI